MSRCLRKRDTGASGDHVCLCPGGWVELGQVRWVQQATYVTFRVKKRRWTRPGPGVQELPSEQSPEQTVSGGCGAGWTLRLATLPLPFIWWRWTRAPLCSTHVCVRNMLAAVCRRPCSTSAQHILNLRNTRGFPGCPGGLQGRPCTAPPWGWSPAWEATLWAPNGAFRSDV